jgi:hypothetical protein
MEHLRLRAAEQVQQGTHPDRWRVQVFGPGGPPSGVAGCADRGQAPAAAAADLPGGRREPASAETCVRASPQRTTPGCSMPRTSNSMARSCRSGATLNTRVSRAMGDLLTARDWLTVFQLPPYASELSPAGGIWSVLKGARGRPGQARHHPQLTALVKIRLTRMQQRAGLLAGFLAGNRPSLTPLSNLHNCPGTCTAARSPRHGPPARRAASRGFPGSGIHGTGTCSSSLSPGRTYQTHAAPGTHDAATVPD